MRRKKITEKVSLNFKIRSSLPSLFHMKISASVTESLHEDCGPHYLHLKIFFLYIQSPPLRESKLFRLLF